MKRCPAYSIKISNSLGLVCYICTQRTDIDGHRQSVSEDIMDAAVFNNEERFETLSKIWTARIEKIPVYIGKDVDLMAEM